ncbi:hypothetical protein PGT21_034564 [Puccinia graminis f. sp. tritici]|uniref:Uncharacterized protein n=1 Tax=Puccinia graminis f. sp. tritici TaxID=56615 RepID=A0A5B0MHB3_PUCGR|nr:hypothetical protein PGT21_034564 [Puccinia graminis f. sp. tritici]
MRPPQPETCDKFVIAGPVCTSTGRGIQPRINSKRFIRFYPGVVYPEDLIPYLPNYIPTTLFIYIVEMSKNTPNPTSSAPGISEWGQGSTPFGALLKYIPRLNRHERTHWSNPNNYSTLYPRNSQQAGFAAFTFASFCRRVRFATVRRALFSTNVKP